jgi:hypothetical protein
MLSDYNSELRYALSFLSDLPCSHPLPVVRQSLHARGGTVGYTYVLRRG